MSSQSITRSDKRLSLSLSSSNTGSGGGGSGGTGAKSIPSTTPAVVNIEKLSNATVNIEQLKLKNNQPDKEKDMKNGNSKITSAAVPAATTNTPTTTTTTTSQKSEGTVSTKQNKETDKLPTINGSQKKKDESGKDEKSSGNRFSSTSPVTTTIRESSRQREIREKEEFEKQKQDKIEKKDEKNDGKDDKINKKDEKTDEQIDKKEVKSDSMERKKKDNEQSVKPSDKSKKDDKEKSNKIIANDSTTTASEKKEHIDDPKKMKKIIESITTTSSTPSSPKNNDIIVDVINLIDDYDDLEIKMDCESESDINPKSTPTPTPIQTPTQRSLRSTPKNSNKDTPPEISPPRSTMTTTTSERPVRISPFLRSEKYKTTADPRSSGVPLSSVATTPRNELTFGSLRSISGRKSIRQLSDYSYTTRESYRKLTPDQHMYDSMCSVNATVGSEIPNDISYRTPVVAVKGHARKRTTYDGRDEYYDDDLLEKVANESLIKKQRLDFSAIFGVIASPITMLRAKFRNTKIQCSTPNTKNVNTDMINGEDNVMDSCEDEKNKLPGSGVDDCIEDDNVESVENIAVEEILEPTEQQPISIMIDEMKDVPLNSDESVEDVVKHLKSDEKLVDFKKISPEAVTSSNKTRCIIM